MRRVLFSHQKENDECLSKVLTELRYLHLTLSFCFQCFRLLVAISLTSKFDPVIFLSQHKLGAVSLLAAGCILGDMKMIRCFSCGRALMKTMQRR